MTDIAWIGIALVAWFLIWFLRPFVMNRDLWRLIARALGRS